MRRALRPMDGIGWARWVLGCSNEYDSACKWPSAQFHSAITRESVQGLLSQSSSGTGVSGMSHRQLKVQVIGKHDFGIFSHRVGS